MTHAETTQSPAPARPPRALGLAALAAMLLLSLALVGTTAWVALSLAQHAATDHARAAQHHADVLTELAAATATTSGLDALPHTLERALAGVGYAEVIRDGQPIATAGDAAVSAAGFDAQRPIPAEAISNATLRLAMPAAEPIPAWFWAAPALLALALLASAITAARLIHREAASLRGVRSALDAFSAGERSPDALAVRAGQTPLADAWNALLQWADDTRAHALDQHAAEALTAGRERRSELRDACDALWLGLVVLDAQGHVQYANGAAAAMLGMSGHDLTSRDFAALTNDEQVAGTLRAVVGGATRQRKSVESDRRTPAGDGGVLRFTIRPSRRDDTAAALVLIEDITQHRVAEAARSSFVAQAAHELRTPLTNIRLYVEELLDADASTEAASPAEAERRRAINVINQEARRLDRIVADMLSISEIEAGQLSIRADDVPLAAMLADLQAEYDAQAREREIAFTLDLPPKLPTLRGDRDKIALALHNLVGNAMKYTPRGGTVTVAAAEDGPAVRVDVRDTGIGISPDDARRVFDKFVRARDSRVDAIPGTGLGLALAREVVRLHGGDITLESELDKGSTFTISLPVTALAA